MGCWQTWIPKYLPNEERKWRSFPNYFLHFWPSIKRAASSRLRTSFITTLGTFLREEKLEKHRKYFPKLFRRLPVVLKYLSAGPWGWEGAGEIIPPRANHDSFNPLKNWSEEEDASVSFRSSAFKEEIPFRYYFFPVPVPSLSYFGGINFIPWVEMVGRKNCNLQSLHLYL